MHTTNPSFEQTCRNRLVQVEAQLSTIGITWTVVEDRVLPALGICELKLTTPGIVGEARIAYGHFPGQDEPCYQLLITTPAAWEAGQLLSRDPAAIVSTLKIWATSEPALLKRALAAISERDLAPLRRLTAIQTAVRQEAQTLLGRGVTRCSEAMGQALGLVRDAALLTTSGHLTAAARERLDEDLSHLAPDLVLTHFPRDADGRLPLDATVLLASYEAQLPQSRDRQMWLAACGPRRRRDPQVVTLLLASLIGVNHAARWDQAHWWWNERHQAADDERRWGVSGLALDQLGLEERADHLARFVQRCAHPDATLADRVGLCLLLQDEGRIEEAFALFDVELTQEVLDILHGQRVYISYPQIESWAITMLDELRRAAPWRFATALKTGKRLRLFALPHQPQQSKASLILTTANQRKGHPRLEIEWTASNKRLAEIAWRRPLDLDLKRFQLQ